jgi:hypothetical protein
MLVFVGAHFFGEGWGSAPTATEWVGLALFPAGVIVGLAIAFSRAKAGALASLASFAAFHLWHVARDGNLPTGPYFLLLASPAVLFLVSGLLDGNATTDPMEDRREPSPSKTNPEEPGCGLGTAS